MDAAQLKCIVAGMARHFRLAAYREISDSCRNTISSESPAAPNPHSGWSGTGKSVPMWWIDRYSGRYHASWFTRADQYETTRLAKKLESAWHLRQATIRKTNDPRFAKSDHGEVYVSMAYVREVLRTKPHNEAIIAHLRVGLASPEPSRTALPPSSYRPVSVEIDTDRFSGYIIGAVTRQPGPDLRRYPLATRASEMTTRSWSDIYLAHRNDRATMPSSNCVQFPSALRSRHRAREKL